jgi:hypothetical protein
LSVTIARGFVSGERLHYGIERQRHEGFVGREVLLARLDQLLVAGDADRWVVVTGGPGMGKSALLAAWLVRREAAGAVVPHHFIRRGQYDWDDPAKLVGSLVAQIEERFPAVGRAGTTPSKQSSTRTSSRGGIPRAWQPRVSFQTLTPAFSSEAPPAADHGEPAAGRTTTVDEQIRRAVVVRVTSPTGQFTPIRVPARGVRWTHTVMEPAEGTKINAPTLWAAGDGNPSRRIESAPPRLSLEYGKGTGAALFGPRARCGSPGLGVKSGRRLPAVGVVLSVSRARSIRSRYSKYLVSPNCSSV